MGSVCHRRPVGESAMTLRDKRALAMGGALVLVAVLVLEVFPWVVRSVVALRSRALAQAATLSRAEEVLAREPEVRDSLALVLNRVVALAPNEGVIPRKSISEPLVRMTPS